MLSCDVIVFEPATKFVFAYPLIGFTPDCGVSYLLPRAVGQQRALAFALTGWPPRRPFRWGLVSEVAEDPDARARDLAAGFAAGPATALGNVRRLLRRGWELSRAETGAEEARTISEMVKGQESQALIARFVER